MTGGYQINIGHARQWCTACGGDNGWHESTTCPNFPRDKMACFVIETKAGLGVRRCRHARAYDVTYRHTNWGREKGYSVTASREGLYCRSHAAAMCALMQGQAEQEQA